MVGQTPKKGDASAALRRSPRKAVGKSPGKGYSPGWVNPRDTHSRFRVKLKARRLQPKDAPKTQMDTSLPASFFLLKTAASSASSSPAKTATSGASTPGPSAKRALAPKQKNKFHKSPLKRRKTSSAADICAEYLVDENSSNALLCSLEQQDRLAFASFAAAASSASSAPKTPAPVDFSQLLGPSDLGPLPYTSSPGPAQIPNRLPVPPLDLRLATKLRLTSSKAFPWPRPDFSLNSDQQSAAFDLAASGQLLSDSSLLSGREADPGTLKTRMGALCEYFVAPSVPWLENFPRRAEEGARRGLGPGSAKAAVPPIINSPPPVLEALRHSWEEAFAALFKAWRNGRVPFFYFAAPNFTVAFVDTRGGEAEGPAQLQRDDSTVSSAAWTLDPNGSRFRAVLSPSTKGLRQALRDEGLDFTTPLRSDSRRNSRSRRSDTVPVDEVAPPSTPTTPTTPLLTDDLVTQSQPPLQFQRCESNSRTCGSGGSGSGADEEGRASEEAEDEDELNRSAEDDPTHWLQDIEISPSAVQKFRRAFSESRLSGGGAEAGGAAEEPAKSALLVQGRVPLQTLFNFLNTTRLTATVTGPMAGLPPTLLSPKPFRHCGSASLSLRAWAGKGSGGSAGEWGVEVSGGPVLPHVPAALASLLASEGARLSVRLRGQSAYQGLNAVVGGSVDSQAADRRRRLEAAQAIAGPASSFRSTAGAELFAQVHHLRFENGAFQW